MTWDYDFLLVIYGIGYLVSVYPITRTLLHSLRSDYELAGFDPDEAPGGVWVDRVICTGMALWCAVGWPISLMICLAYWLKIKALKPEERS
jgi:hypothetical protein